MSDTFQGLRGFMQGRLAKVTHVPSPWPSRESAWIEVPSWTESVLYINEILKTNKQQKY